MCKYNISTYLNKEGTVEPDFISRIRENLALGVDEKIKANYSRFFKDDFLKKKFHAMW
jgi:hypothetical protein